MMPIPMICIDRADGGCSVGAILKDENGDLYDPETIVEKVTASWGKGGSRKRFLPIKGWRIITPQDIEAHNGKLKNHRIFRAAWKVQGAKVVHDIAKCRVIKTGQVREERDKRLPIEDIELMKATEEGDTAKADAIKAKKRKLRDMPATVQAPLKALKTIEDLEAFEPTWP